MRPTLSRNIGYPSYPHSTSSLPPTTSPHHQVAGQARTKRKPGSVKCHFIWLLLFVRHFIPPRKSKSIYLINCFPHLFIIYLTRGHTCMGTILYLWGHTLMGMNGLGCEQLVVFLYCTVACKLSTLTPRPHRPLRRTAGFLYMTSLPLPLPRKRKA